MKKILSASWLIYGATGALAGYLYWYFVGCNSGTCAITSSPVNSTLYGVVMALLLKGSIIKEK